jgi:membrane associated rhomboid family serine protease
MLEDRDYMRQPEFEEQRWRPRLRLRWSWTTALLVAYAVVFFVEIIFSPAPSSFVPGNDFCSKYFALSKEGIEHGFVWQLVTYQFMHARLLHLLLNCWAIYVFGRELEQLLGARRFLALIFSSGIVGGVFQVLFQVLTAMVWPERFHGPVVGASACAFGLVAAFAMIFPERELTMLIFFVIPVRMRAKTLLIFSGVLAVLGVVFSKSIFGGNVAHAAHLGGMAMGWFYVKKILKNPALIGAVDETQFTQPKLKKKAVMPVEKSPGEFLESEVDPILDKISAHGIHSLTPRERAVLESARKKMAQR